MELYDFKVKNNVGEDVSMSAFKGRVLLIVNTATGCGFTPQYEGLQRLYEKYNAQGFDVLDFPCNQFGHQAPGSDAEIESFCTLKYNTTFPRFAKVNVNGEGAAPLFKYLKECTSGFLGSRIKWNFTKFLVSREGKVARRYAPMVAPERIETDIKLLL